MSTIEKLLLGSQSTLLTGANLQNMANNALVVGSAFDNTVGESGDGYTLCDLEGKLVFGTAPADNTAMAVWFLLSQDGTNYEDGSTSITPARAPDVVFPFLNTNGTTQIVNRRVLLPWGKFEPL